MSRRPFSDKTIQALKPRDKLYRYPDPALPSFYVNVLPSGVKSYVAVAKAPDGKQKWVTLGKCSDIGLDAARQAARAAMAAVRGGNDSAGPDTFQAVSEQWLARYVERKGLRTADRTRWQLKKYLLPVWGNREFASIRRGDIVRLLDEIEDKSGARTADLVLSTISGLVTFHAQRHEDYVSPLVKGMRRYDKAANARDRILTDNEIRELWDSVPGPNGALKTNDTLDIARLALLTAQRIDKVRTMRWSDTAEDGTWTIPAEAREKVNAGELLLPEAALEIIRRQPRIASNPYVFAGRYYGEPISYNAVDSAIKKLGAEWKLHDLRRAAKSLMARAGVLPHISERVLGHVIQGVEGVYDRHSYRDEKAHALKALAALVANILAPAEDKVVALRG